MPHVLRRQMDCDRPNFAARILVAEDNMVNQEVATGILHNVGNVLNSMNAANVFLERR